MAKKKKLVKNLQEIIDSGDLEEFKKVFEKCEITATDAGKTTSNAFSYRNLTPEHIQFLIDGGLDPNSDCGFGYTAVAYQASNADNLKCLINNGADIDLVVVPYRGTALASACSRFDVDAVRNLLEANASVSVTGDLDRKPLIDLTLSHCDNIYIPYVLEISRLLLDKGAATTSDTPGYVRKIGERFEFFRDSINKDLVDDLSQALDELYSLFGVDPVQQRVMHDGSEKIVVKGTTWPQQYNELWNMLVPGSGKAQTVQGEMIRIAGRVANEILDNGGINWDSDYKEMLNALDGFICQLDAPDPVLADGARKIIAKVTASTDKKTLYRLTEIVVAIVIANPQPVPLGDVSYIR